MECGEVPFQDCALLLALVREDEGSVKRALLAGAYARRRLRRDVAQRLLGPSAHLGSQWWGKQDSFPLIYFASKWGTEEWCAARLGERCGSLGTHRRHQAHASAPASAAEALGTRSGSRQRCGARCLLHAPLP